MNVGELENLADWYVDHFEGFEELYQQLVNALQHNANQPNKQPIEEPMSALTTYFEEMDFDALSLQQLKMLQTLGVEHLIGHEGATFIDSTIRTANFDPATGAQQLNEAFSAISNAKTNFVQFLDALDPLDLRGAGETEEHEFITIRVGFQQNASIGNVTEWKNSAKDWYDIIRGLALAANEAPEDTRVVGATSGSIILILAATATITTLLARISKHVTGTAKEVLEIGHSIEELRHKKLLTKAIKEDLERQRDERKTTALQAIFAEITPLLPETQGDATTALTSSIKKLLAFNERGGNVDFVAPHTEETSTEDASEAVGGAKSAITSAREAIHEYQEMREALKLLTFQGKRVKKNTSQ